MSDRKRILITAGGTSTAWHMCNIAKRYFDDKIEVHVCDINPREMVASSKIADVFHCVPKILDKDYKSEMLMLLRREKIDYIIPLIDLDLFIFPKDDDDLGKLGICSTGPLRSTVELLSNKYKMAFFLKENAIYTPDIYDIANVCNEKEYVIKPRVGYGSKGIKVIGGSELRKREINENLIIQDRCNGGKKEITAEVFNAHDMVKVFCRERVETKEGVCTKMRVVNEPEIVGQIRKLVCLLDMPSAFCAQFMKHNGHWNLIDCNLRIGAGTALASACGFQLTRAFFANLMNEDIFDAWFEVDDSIRAVVRVYQEEVMR